VGAGEISASNESLDDRLAATGRGQRPRLNPPAGAW
jgi:hypothetical protein